MEALKDRKIEKYRRKRKKMGRAASSSLKAPPDVLGPSFHRAVHGYCLVSLCRPAATLQIFSICGAVGFRCFFLLPFARALATARASHRLTGRAKIREGNCRRLGGASGHRCSLPACDGKDVGCFVSTSPSISRIRVRIRLSCDFVTLSVVAARTCISSSDTLVDCNRQIM